MSESNIRRKSAICSPFAGCFITSNFSSTAIVFHRFFAWIALGDADLYFLITLVRKVNAVEEETTSST